MLVKTSRVCLTVYFSESRIEIAEQNAKTTKENKLLKMRYMHVCHKNVNILLVVFLGANCGFVQYAIAKNMHVRDIPNQLKCSMEQLVARNIRLFAHTIS